MNKLAFSRGTGLIAMVNDPDQALEVDVLAASLRMDQSESGDLLEYLATKLAQALPQNTKVIRGGWFLSAAKPVNEITVSFDECQFQIVRERHGSFTARTMKVVRGVVLKTTEIQVDEWADGVARELARMAERNAQTRQALRKFVIG